MTHIELGHVTMAIEDLPHLRKMYEANQEACEKAVIVGDLSILFASLIRKYGVSESAEFIESSLKHAIEIVENEG